MSLHEPYLIGCLSPRNELSLISFSQSEGRLDCHLLTLNDLRPPERAQVKAGLPAGTLDDAIGQLRELAANSLLPPCPPPRATSPPAPTTPSTTDQTPAPSDTSLPASAPPAATDEPETDNPETDTAPANTTPEPPASTATSLPAPSSPTLTTLPPSPPQQGVDCRAAA